MELSKMLFLLTIIEVSESYFDVKSETSTLGQPAAEIALVTSPGKFSTAKIFTSLSFGHQLEANDLVTDFVRRLNSNLKCFIWETKAFVKISTRVGRLSERETE